MARRVYDLVEPGEPVSPAIFNVPHSGRDYEPAFLKAACLDPLQIRSSEDAYVDELVAAAPAAGAPLLTARVPRAVVDLNRAEDELDPSLIAGLSRRTTSPRIAAGLGVIPRVVAEGRPIRSGRMTLAEAERRISQYHRPYHAALRALIEAQRARFGQAILFDFHSMPHDALFSAPMVWGRRPQVILGDRFGASCGRWLIEAATRIFTEAGFIVARNAPFAGGYITQHYGRPAQGVHCLQIEIDRALYMDEARIERLPNFAQLRARLDRVVTALAAIDIERIPLAAE